jgi:SAM-dependent methyltransferase
MAPAPAFQEKHRTFTKARIAGWDAVARLRGRGSAGGYYHKRLAQIYSHLIPPGLRVLEIGCGTGDLLAAVNPSLGVGVDFSRTAVGWAAKKHPRLRFVLADAHALPVAFTFDAIIISDLVNDLWDVQAMLAGLSKCVDPRTRIFLNSYSRLWENPLAAASAAGLAATMLRQNWFTVQDVANLLDLADIEVLRTWQEVLFPLRLPLVDTLCNKVLVKLFPFYALGLTNMIVAHPRRQAGTALQNPLVSVIVPARNEAGNIEAIFSRVPAMGSGTELVFVEGGSADGTYAAIEAAMAKFPNVRCSLAKQTGRGKGDAVRLGLSHAGGDVLMILDADLSVPPEDLPRFYNALVSGKGEFVNGVRLVYPMEKQAMRFLNGVANKILSILFSWLLGQPVRDTLCGTKAFWKQDYAHIAANRSYFGDFDPFGDYDLLFGAAKRNLKIVEIPVRYQERTYGKTNISRWRNGFMLLRMVLFAMWKIKFV